MYIFNLYFNKERVIKITPQNIYIYICMYV